MRIVPVPVLADNYAYLVIADSGRAAVVDPSEAGPVLEAAKREGALLTAVWNTHHHWDHTGGNRDLLRDVAALQVVGYGPDSDRIPGITRGVADGETFDFEGTLVVALSIPAHTSGHVAFHLPAENVVFTGDTLFAGGCGRLFEGDATQMLSSLSRLARLPQETLVYCGHEYTEKNLRFALTLEPGNRALAAKHERVKALTLAGQPSVPTTIAEELATNPFLRSEVPEIVRSIADRFPETSLDSVSVLARTRELKDQF